MCQANRMINTLTDRKRDRRDRKTNIQDTQSKRERKGGRTMTESEK